MGNSCCTSKFNGQGSKTTPEWKKSFGDWKLNTKKKYSMIRQNQTGTGHGPGSTSHLSDVELRLLQLMGKTAVDGDVGVEEYGLSKQDESMVKTPTTLVRSPETLLLTPQNLSTEKEKKRRIIADYSDQDERENMSDFNGDSSNVPRGWKKKVSNHIEEMNNVIVEVLRRIDVGRVDRMGRFDLLEIVFHY